MKIYLLASNLLPLYLVKFECSKVQLDSKVIQFKGVENIYHRYFSFISLYTLIYNITACVQNVHQRH